MRAWQVDSSCDDSLSYRFVHQILCVSQVLVVHNTVMDYSPVIQISTNLFDQWNQPIMSGNGLSPDELGAFVFLGVLLLCVLVAGCLTYWMNRCLLRKRKRREKLMRNMYNAGMDPETDTEGKRNGATGTYKSQFLNETDNSFGAFLVHVPGSTAMPYCSRDSKYQQKVNLM